MDDATELAVGPLHAVDPGLRLGPARRLLARYHESIPERGKAQLRDSDAGDLPLHDDAILGLADVDVGQPPLRPVSFGAARLEYDVEQLVDFALNAGDLEERSKVSVHDAP